MLEPSYTGEVKLTSNHTLKFPLTDEASIKFDMYYKYRKEGNISLSHPYLVAVFENEHNLNKIDTLEENLNDLLVLVSFAEKVRIICFGRILYSEKYVVREFNANWTVVEPEPFETSVQIPEDNEL